MKAITEFSGSYRWLSNFYPAWVWLDLNGKREDLYPTVENAYQAAKLRYRADRRLLVSVSPSESKILARRLGLQPGWESSKVDVMLNLLRQKFAPNLDKIQDYPGFVQFNGVWMEPLAAKLLATGDAELIEGNTWGDVFWGVCKGKGENTLGKLIMQVRSEIVQQLAKRG